MQIDIHKTEQESRWLHRGAWAALVLGLLISGISWRQAGHHLQDKADAAFAQQSADISAHLGQLLDHHLDVLRSFQAMFMASAQVSRQAFHQLHLNLDVAG